MLLAGDDGSDIAFRVRVMVRVRVSVRVTVTVTVTVMSLLGATLHRCQGSSGWKIRCSCSG